MRIAFWVWTAIVLVADLAVIALLWSTFSGYQPAEIVIFSAMFAFVWALGVFVIRELSRSASERATVRKIRAASRRRS